MAKVLFGAPVSVITGKMGGNFFQTGPYGPVLSRINRPTVRRQLTQFHVRILIGVIAHGWQTLTTAEQDSWKTAAGSSGLGYDLYMKHNFYYYKINGSILRSYVAPTPLLSVKPDYLDIFYYPAGGEYALKLYYTGTDIGSLSSYYNVFAADWRPSPSAKPQFSWATRVYNHPTYTDGTGTYTSIGSRLFSNHAVLNSGMQCQVWSIFYDGTTGVAITPALNASAVAM